MQKLDGQERGNLFVPTLGDTTHPITYNWFGESLTDGQEGNWKNGVYSIKLR